MGRPRSARHKYGAVRTTVGGVTYASKAEARYATWLEHQRQAGVVVGWLEQTPFKLPGGVRYVSDFLVFLADGSCELVDIKGVETAAFKIKKRLMAEAYPWIPLIVIHGSDVPRA